MELTEPRRKFPWELHVIACLLLLLIGYAVSQNTRGIHETEPLIIFVSVPVCLFGLFRGSLAAWWGTLLTFIALSVMGVAASVDLFDKYGFRAHPVLLHTHLLAAVSVTVTGLLLSCRIRGAFPDPARPLMEELTAFTRLAAIVAPILFVIAAFFSLTLAVLFSSRRHSGYSGYSSSLKTLASAEADFRANDRDGNGINDFWVGDVAGLYGLVPKGPPNSPSIKLIELSIAAADGDPLAGWYPAIPASPRPKANFWYQALASDRSIRPPKPYRTGNQPYNLSQFGFIAYPDDHIDGGKYAFIVSENYTIFRCALTGDIKASDRVPPGRLKLADYTDWPSDDELKANWSKLD
jgi:hypothetical protein